MHENITVYQMHANKGGSNLLLYPPKMINYKEIPSNLVRLHRGGPRYWFF